MIKRIVVALALVPIIFACTISGGTPFIILVSLLTLISLNEFYNMLKGKGFSPFYVLGNIFSLAVVMLLHFVTKTPLAMRLLPEILTLAVITIFCAAVFVRKSSMATANIAITLLGVLYIGWLFGYLVLLRSLVNVNALPGIYLFFLMFTIWANDTVAYFFGKKFGRRQLSPYISPKKTIEGAIAGAVAAIAMSYVFCVLIERAYNPALLPHYLIMGLIVAVIGQISDLSESLIKRDAGVKDSSGLVPGHGGILDRMDSFIFTAPLIYYYVSWFIIK